MFVLLQKNHSAEPAINRFANRVFDHEMKKSTVALIAPRLWAQPHYLSGPGAVSPFPTLWQHKSSYISTFLQSNVTNNYQSRGSDTERRGRCLVLMQASGGSLLAKELHSQPVTVTNLAWHQADIQYPSTLSADWLEVIDLEQWGHLLNALKLPFCSRIAKLGQRSSRQWGNKMYFLQNPIIKEKLPLCSIERPDAAVLFLTLHFIVMDNRCLIFLILEQAPVC